MAHRRVFDHLEASGQSNLTAAAREFAIRHAGKGSSSPSPTSSTKRIPGRTAILAGRNMDIYVIHILSQEEVAPELVGDLRLIVDCEDEETAEITISAPFLKRYKDNLNAFVGGLKEWCTQRGITYIFTNNQYPFDKLILNYLRELRAGEVTQGGYSRSLASARA